MLLSPGKKVVSGLPLQPEALPLAVTVVSGVVNVVLTCLGNTPPESDEKDKTTDTLLTRVKQ